MIEQSGARRSWLISAMNQEGDVGFFPDCAGDLQFLIARLEMVFCLKPKDILLLKSYIQILEVDGNHR
jgi:hypothetical protein